MDIGAEKIEEYVKETWSDEGLDIIVDDVADTVEEDVEDN